MHTKIAKEIQAYDPNDYLENLELHLETLEERKEKLFDKLNVCQSLCEFYSFGNPQPDYIFYIGEAVGELGGFIPLKTTVEEYSISREARWNEIRAMFRNPMLILDLMNLDP